MADRAYREDNYVNMLNKYGAAQDNSTAYRYENTGGVPDAILTEQYETNGLFAKIIDAPADEAIRHGYDLGLNNPETRQYINDLLDRLEWEEKASTAIKWSRLYGGALGVMLIDDGGGIDEPLNRRRIKGIDEIRVYERAIVQPDCSSLYNYDSARGAPSKFGMPEYYQVNSIYGQFRVHESRCLIFRNGVLPEHTMQPSYRFWGLPEYLRIRRELRETITSHSTGVKMLERSVQAVYAMKDLASQLAAIDGMDIVICRLQAIDMARNIMNSIAIDNDGESYEFKTIPMAGVKEVIDTTCNMLSAVTNIPQTILFGRSPAGQNSTGLSDLENWYNFVEKIQKLQLRNNLRNLISLIIATGIRTGKLSETPEIKLNFNPLWSLSASDQAAVDAQQAQTRYIKAQTAQIYVEMTALDPTEVRRGLAREEEFQVEELLDDTVPVGDMWGAEAKPVRLKVCSGGIEGESQNSLTKHVVFDSVKYKTDDKQPRDEDGRFTNGGTSLSNARVVKTNFPKGSLSGKAVKTFLESEGYVVIKNRGKQSGKGSHVKMKGPNGEITHVPVHRNKSLGKGLLSEIKKQTGYK